MRALICIAIIAIGYHMFFGGNSKRDNYDKGYEAAWEEGIEPSKWASKEEKEGYEAGADDSWCYDTGYADGYDDKSPKYYKDALYMDGYKDGKADKARGI